MTQLLRGRALAETIRQKMKERMARFHTAPGLAVLLVGDDPASHTYVRLKERACREAGIRFEKFLYLASATEETLTEKIRELNQRKDINGVLVQLPLPGQNENRVVAAIDPDKDVDGFHPESLRRMEAGEPGLISPVALGVMKLIEKTGKDVAGMSACVMASELFAKPFLQLLAEHRAHIVSETKNADILIVAVGRPRTVTGDRIKPGAIVIDVGTTRVGDKIVGDADRASVEGVASYLTPVPGGVGPMTVAMLILNVAKAYERQQVSYSRRPDHGEDDAA
jgi:methylenetetrahydrofolate dehydrogenase (NADP+)/methenyltetrahydrofolate cyclohydrolase